MNTKTVDLLLLRLAFGWLPNRTDENMNQIFCTVSTRRLQRLRVTLGAFLLLMNVYPTTPNASCTGAVVSLRDPPIPKVMGWAER
jgi:hypothetical protein